MFQVQSGGDMSMNIDFNEGAIRHGFIIREVSK